MFDLKTGVAHLLTRFSSPFHCRLPIGGSKHHYNKVHPEVSGCKPRGLLRIGFGDRFASVKSRGSHFGYQKVSYVTAALEVTPSVESGLENLWFMCVLSVSQSSFHRPVKGKE
jgi:hypothetical protein